MEPVLYCMLDGVSTIHEQTESMNCLKIHQVALNLSFVMGALCPKGFRRRIPAHFGFEHNCKLKFSIPCLGRDTYTVAGPFIQTLG